MKKFQSKAALAVLGLGVLTLALPASAQDLMRATVPFSFVVGNETLPAGDYNFKVSADYLHSSLVALKDGSVHPLHFAPGGTRQKESRLYQGTVQFRKYGDRYFLSQVWKPGNPDGFAAITSKRMIESAKAQGVPAETVSIDSEIK